MSTQKEQSWPSINSHFSENFAHNGNRGSSKHVHNSHDIPTRSSPQTQQRDKYNQPPSQTGGYSPNDSFRPDAHPTLPAMPSDPSQFTVGTLVVIKSHEGHDMYGTIQWMGSLKGFDGYFAGIELVS